MVHHLQEAEIIKITVEENGEKTMLIMTLRIMVKIMVDGDGGIEGCLLEHSRRQLETEPLSLSSVLQYWYI